MREEAINNTLGAINSSISEGSEIDVDLSMSMLDSISNTEINDVEVAELPTSNIPDTQYIIGERTYTPSAPGWHLVDMRVAGFSSNLDSLRLELRVLPALKPF